MYNLLTILGPTASGKTTLAAHVAYHMKGEIISGDSRQIYRGMDLGTGKDLEDYCIEGQPIPYHLVDIRKAGYKYNVYEFQQDFVKAYQEILQTGHLPILCGGTGLYIEAVLKGFKLIHVPRNVELREKLEEKSLEELEQILKTYKTLHNNTDIDTVRRAVRAIEIEEYYAINHDIDLEYPKINPLIVGVGIDRDARRDRISSRLKKRFEEGMVDEVRTLLDQGVTAEELIYYGLEYKFITRYVIGEISYEEMFNGLEIAIHQFSKRQMTWFRGMERRGFKIHWLDAFLPTDEKVRQIEEWYSQG